MTKRKAGPGVSAEEILKSHTPEIRALVERLRRIIRQAVPEAAESAHLVWHSLSYHHPHSGYFCGIFPQPELVSLAFEFGILLPDPDGLLKGTGKQVRFIRVKSGRDIRVRPLKKLLRAAAALPPRREFKLQLARPAVRRLKDHD
jgi:hypothetical protein